MEKKKIIIFSIIFSFTFALILLFGYFSSKTKKNTETTSTKIQDDIYSSNIIDNVNYSTNDADGNSYIITALTGEIDYSNANIVYLTDVKALIKLTNSNEIIITSNFGKYNINNFDTIFSKNVIVKYLDNKINSEYLDFSLKRNSMIISKNVVYKNLENILKGDVVEINIKTKDTKIYRYNIKDKVNIKSINENGNN
tara:strand:+ start:534 stop:1124 length:591 start_codon:yes stop_codon:yes gene_type:complete